MRARRKGASKGFLAALAMMREADAARPPVPADAPDGSPLATKARTAPDTLPHSPLDRDGLVERLRERIAVLEKALEPFARVAELLHEGMADSVTAQWYTGQKPDGSYTTQYWTAGHFRQARAALSASGGKNGNDHE